MFRVGSLIFAASINLAMATTSDISRGLILKLDGSLYSVVEFGENKTARAAAKVWAKLKGVDNNRSIEKTWNSGDNIFPVRVERKAYQFLYKDDTGFNFMDNETFEQAEMSADFVGDLPLYMLPNNTVVVNWCDGKPISIEMPNMVELIVKDTAPGIKGATATNQLKEATCETGLKTRVPPFITIGEKIIISTADGSYRSRA